MARIRMIMWYTVTMTCFIFTYPAIFYARYLHNKQEYDKRDWYAHKFMSRLARFLFYVSGSRLTIVGSENIPKNRPVLFVSNHQGHMDSVVILGFIKKSKGFISITEFERFPIMGKWMEYMGSVFIERGNIRQTFLTINKAKDNLKRGQSMVVFPEGKLSDGNKVTEFERGWMLMIRNIKVPIVPITVSGSYKILAYDGKTMKPGRIQCTISEPIETDGLKKEDEQAFLENLRSIILSKI